MDSLTNSPVTAILASSRRSSPLVIKATTPLTRLPKRALPFTKYSNPHPLDPGLTPRPTSPSPNLLPSHQHNWTH
ncbi:hypothetical protein AOQ84DRAFT_49409 [Glonium stellatum]|uniref:Uncharacterized protein n=1 Tax=Glonium stellatum TaxID=574774 RepID=A0A8E2FC28_9PEZI|nr:hypothetical protein AOQ84DRAFT_49409 [Glonium stellatum]